MNHIEKLQAELAKLQAQPPSARSISEMQLLQIGAILAVAQELHIANVATWQPDGVAHDERAETVAVQLSGALLREVAPGPDRDGATEWGGCTHPGHDCYSCPDKEKCEFPF